MIVKLFTFWRLGLFLVTYLGSLVLPKIENGGLGAIGKGHTFNFWTSWAQWDGGHYFGIAESGYLLFSDYAFFPLFPFLVRVVNLLLGNLILSGLIVSNIAFLIFLLIFFKVIKEKYSPKVAQLTIGTFLVFPTTFFAVAFYSESLFLLLCALTFLLLSRKKFLFAAIATSLASLTRSPGVILIISIFYSYFATIHFKPRLIDKRFLYILVAPFGFIFYGLYLFFKVNDPFKFLTIQSSWERSVIDPITTFVSYIWVIATGQQRPINDYFDLALTLLFLAILILGRRKIPSSWWIFSMAVILLPASFGTLTSMPRYLLSSLGSFVIIAQYLKERPRLRIVLWSLSLFSQAVLATRFILGYWVA
ncbi:hypothetical protein A2697_01485 [Candidatus Curtissbacteria bacterium RIFCSPHIGHO2_01_FULL_41_44]|uniref:Glycosyltransferase RgtA/B/C/D-like domain-containing protein n=1 Tax=Candidatus Curtissbacteria bacterium RIFCSPLOWO2_01_FULL_42_50 TaxID=1797730 RepID=A0A1F5H3J4_9BACT|nr:MAG: hypothetical protein A3C33_00695 [Candidatus Curtissbacteria bacterium RIFCSPHIGHO2_02_FULL_42_58]OGD94581.1 MAG: hypothetical protein A2697_01485 [Candidatus Curtissbacteria bacterium RIFCSPHIGHO2_01_FULL_41_44]OGD97963.1 MAG: hypothetical protein A3E71_03955 [Candidatus Curtissbacteria bacterium RIFCSPHIGHO2_12_FULL_42_33]OGD98614.1 MAG: hypothetical protein A3B54_05530 [Candidatus Curtissbacteria bacterium RIFCSPLOWO2_01_FULL_42_50]OGE02181.1 MAG: hypothetical protein A3G16_02340 [Ca